ncbi:MAG TPA: glycosyltransferase family 39 protein, partial [Flavobacteriales bacterium]|nr:glycosyltransferase family 39 protein [Flavobacteriales bacterium]
MATARKRILQRTGGHHKYFVLFVLVLGLVLRAWRLNEPVSYDEALTWTEYARKSFGFLLSDYTFTSNHILYSALAKISVLLFGLHPWSLRLPALVAGMLVLPLAYLFVRMVFNRHIAVIFLCLLAVSSPLVEYSAMARGYSLVWLFTICALLAGRHFVKSENWVSAVLLATSTALGMWAAPVMVYPAVMAYFWTLFMLMTNYQSTLRRRVLKLAGSFLLAGGLASLCYAPVIAMHSLDSLLHHPSLADHTWNHFVNTQQDQAFGVWAYLT